MDLHIAIANHFHLTNQFIPEIKKLYTYKNNPTNNKSNNEIKTI